MTRDELRDYKRKWMRRFRFFHVRISIKKEKGYKDAYLERPKNSMNKCPICTMLLESEWHQKHAKNHPQTPFQAEEVMIHRILDIEQSMNGQ